MKLKDVTPQQFDTFMASWAETTTPDEYVELTACAELAEYSRSVGVICRTVRGCLANTVTNEQVLNAFGSLVAAGVRIGWHLRDQQMLDGLLSNDEMDALRREIREQA